MRSLSARTSSAASGASAEVTWTGSLTSPSVGAGTDTGQGSSPSDPSAESGSRSGESRNADGAVDRHLAEHPRAVVEHGALAGREAEDRLVGTYDEGVGREPRDGGHGIGVSPHLHVAPEVGAGPGGLGDRAGPGPPGAAEVAGR